MIVDRIGNREPRCLRQGRIKLLHPRIQPSHNTLQFGKFLDLMVTNEHAFVSEYNAYVHLKLAGSVGL